MSSSSSPPTVVPKTKGITIEKLQAQLNDRDHLIDDLERKLYGDKKEHIIDADSEIIRLRKKLEHAERLVGEYKEQLNTQTLKTSVNNSKNHLSEIELEKLRIRLQQRIEELEPLPELLRQAEMKNHEIQTCILEQEKRLVEQSAVIAELNSKVKSKLKKKHTQSFNVISLDKCAKSYN
jgi:chromosome segregation ATPase